MNNIDKILYYIKPFSKVNIDVNGEVTECNVASIKLGEMFFATDGCNMCGFCCIPEDNVFLPFEYDAIMALEDDTILDYGRRYGEENGLPLDFVHNMQKDMKTSTISVNGAPISIYTYKGPHPVLHLEGRGDRDRCPHVHVRPDGKVVCGIHPVRSITCRMPHLRVYHSHAGTTTLNIAQYGRNWALKCSVAFSEPKTAEEFESNKQDRLEKLVYLNRCATELSIDTYIPEVIKYVESCTWDNYKSRLNSDILRHKKVKSLF